MVKVTNENLKDFLLYYFNQEDLSSIDEEQVKQIETITIEGNKNKLESLQDLDLFENLKNITIKNIKITKENLKRIIQLNKIEKIQFIYCTIMVKEIVCNPNWKEITFSFCDNVKISSTQELKAISIIGGKNIKLEGLENATNLRKLYLQYLQLKNLKFITSLKKLDYININGSIIEKCQLEYLQNSNVKIEWKPNNNKV